jgi:Pentapeptide repeats (8 copies)
MGFMRAIQVTWVTYFLLTLCCCFLSGLHAQTPPPSDPLTKAQIENQRAQATYYKRQADKRGFWRNLREYGGQIGAAVAAVVAIISFGLIYRATLRSRIDTRFYETLNLFTDRENPSVRSSAAGILEQMASTRRHFYGTAFDQLSVALLAEKDDHVRNAIQSALGRMVELDPATALAKLEAMNRALRDALADSVCKFFVARELYLIEEVTDEVWGEAEEVTSYDRQALTALLQILPKDNLLAILTAATRTYRTVGKSETDGYRASTRFELGKCAEHLRSNIRSISELLLVLEGKGQSSSSGSYGRVRGPKSFTFAFLVGGSFHDLQECKISRSILREASFIGANLTRAVLIDTDLSRANLGGAKLCEINCSGTKLVGAVLKQADLTGAKFQNCDLSGTDLTGAKFRNTTIALAALENAEWWKADFRHQRDLLKAIHGKYKKNIPDLESLYVRGDIHRSVLDFIGKITEERL